MGNATDYRNDDKWAVFADAYIETNGNCTQAAEIAGVNKRTAQFLRRENRDFQVWLDQHRRKRLEKREIAVENKLITAIDDDKEISAGKVRTYRFFAEWTGKLADRSGGITVNGDLNLNQTNISFSQEERQDLLRWAFDNKNVIEGKAKEALPTA